MLSYSAYQSFHLERTWQKVCFPQKHVVHSMLDVYMFILVK